MTRSLTGNIDDLGLDEIVHVIAIARRSGVLTVESPAGTAELSFTAGRLVSGRLQDATDTAADVLVRACVLEDDELFAPPGTPESSETLDALLARLSIDRDEPGLAQRADDIIREALQLLTARVLMYTSGQFHFRVFDDDAPMLRYPKDTARTYPAGIDTDDIVRETKRRKLDKRADPLAGYGAATARKATASDHPELFLVDDDAAFLEAACKAVSDVGVQVAALGGARQAIDRFFALGASDGTVMVVDLTMPRSSGRGLLGGLELLRRAAQLDIANRVFLALDDDHEDASNIARALGAAGIVKKPKLDSATDEPLFAGYLNPVLERLRRAPLMVRGYDLARELRDDFGERSGEWQTDGGKIVDESIRSLEVLQGLLGELNHPSFDEEIPLLVLRFASAFFVRGALFSVDKKRDQLSGIGGFGLGVLDPGRLVHSIHVPLHADTVFVRALRERRGVRQQFFESEWNVRLSTLLGGPRPRDVYTAPLISPRGIEAILYADNATEQRQFPDVHLLEIFLQQSAAALERANLAREVKRLLAASV